MRYPTLKQSAGIFWVLAVIVAITLQWSIINDLNHRLSNVEVIIVAHGNRFNNDELDLFDHHLVLKIHTDILQSMNNMFVEHKALLDQLLLNEGKRVDPNRPKSDKITIW